MEKAFFLTFTKNTGKISGTHSVPLVKQLFYRIKAMQITKRKPVLGKCNSEADQTGGLQQQNKQHDRSDVFDHHDV